MKPSRPYLKALEALATARYWAQGMNPKVVEAIEDAVVELLKDAEACNERKEEREEKRKYA